MSSIRTRLTALLLAFCLLPTTVLLVSGYVVLRDDALWEAGMEAERSAIQGAQRLVDRLHYAREAVSSWAATSSVRSFSASGLHDRALRALKGYFRSYGTFSAVLLVNVQGDVIVASDDALVGDTLARVSWWQDHTSEQAFTGSLVFDPVVGGFAVPLVEPVRRADGGSVQGYLVAYLAWSELVALMQGVEAMIDEVSPNHFAVLLDEHEYAVAGPDFALLDERVEDLPDRVGNVRFPELGLDGGAGHARLPHPLKSDDTQAVVGYACAKALDPHVPLDWSVLVVIDRAAILEGVVQTRDALIALTLLLSGIAWLLVRHAANRIASPIQTLTRHALTVASGDFGRTINIRTSDEIGVLSRALDRLSLTIATNIEQLNTALDKAQSSERAKSEFLATMSHEIRTPLNGVLGVAEILADSELTEEQRYYLDTINQSGTALLGLINDILDFSKIEAGELHLEQAEVDLVALIEEIGHTYAPLAHGKGLEIVCDIDPSAAACVLGDALRLRQVLANLVSNACKFTHEGEITLAVSLSDRQGDRGRFRFSVSDTGIGLTPEQAAVVFQTFKQADSSTTRSYGGTGLGLTISTSIVELMGGELVVESAAGQGATFFFEVELTVARLVAEARLDGVLVQRVAIVDSSSRSGSALARLLAGWCVESVVYADQHSALLGLEGKEQFDLVIASHRPPQTDGLEFAELLKERFSANRFPLFLLGEGERPRAAVRSRLGVDAWLPKPVRRKDLLEAFRSLDGRQVVSYPSEAQGFEPLAMQVLVAEDNAVNQMVISRMLSSFGCEAVIAENGARAVQMQQERRFDLILMDCLMPELDGFAATAAIREQESGNDAAPIPIIALTANAVEGDRQRCLQAGMSDYVAKPVKRDTLYEALSRWRPVAL